MQPSSQVAASGSIGSFNDAVQLVYTAINQLLPLIISLTLLVFIWGIFKFVLGGDSEEKRTEGRAFMIYGIIGLAVMVSVWGLVHILTSTLFGSALIVPQLK
ncbi:MAG: hypothetical protein PHF79_00490 [Candidatus Pacebacteria bacterium]|nr:hypothetical protein [Candidatus Paceibacterota bacterium]